MQESKNKLILIKKTKQPFKLTVKKPTNTVGEKTNNNKCDASVLIAITIERKLQLEKQMPLNKRKNKHNKNRVTEILRKLHNIDTNVDPKNRVLKYKQRPIKRYKQIQKLKVLQK